MLRSLSQPKPKKGGRPKGQQWHNGIDPAEIIANYERLKSSVKVGELYDVSGGTIQTFLKTNFEDRYYAIASRPTWHSGINPAEIMATYERLGSLGKTGALYGVTPRPVQWLLAAEFPARYEAVAKYHQGTSSRSKGAKNARNA